VVIILVLIYLCLLAKDTLPLGDPYILRGISQLMALVGGFWLFVHSGMRLRLNKYLVLVLYFLSVAISAVLSDEMLYSSLQALSLGAILFFFVTYLESPGDKASKGATLENVVVWVGTVVCLLSLAAAKVAPSVAYQFMPGEGIYRFQGVFGQPSALAANAGIVSGIILFSRRKWYVKLPLACPPLACLVLSFARTFWVGWVVAAVWAVWWISKNSRLKILGLGIFGLLIGLLMVSVAGVDTAHLRRGFDKAVRMQSVGNLTGRVAMWKAALDEFGKRPFFGYGFSVGDEAFGHGARTTLAASTARTPAQKRHTLHNGYLQALLDTGLFGVIFYLLVLAKTQTALLIRSRERYATVLFVIVFLAASNMAETVMFTAATAHSALGWYYVVFALSLAGREARPSTPQVAAVRTA
jgi:O-antigen ligase